MHSLIAFSLLRRLPRTRRLARSPPPPKNIRPCCKCSHPTCPSPLKQSLFLPVPTSLSFSAHVLYRAFPLLSPHLFSATHDCDLPLGLNFRSALSQLRNVDDDVTYPWPPHTTFEFNRRRFGFMHYVSSVGGCITAPSPMML